MSDDSDDVMGVLATRIEERFRMSLPALRRAVAVAPHASPDAAEAVRWYGLLATAQESLDRAEDALVAVLMAEAPGELDDPAMEAAQRVNTGVDVRDGRAMVLRFLLDPDAPGRRGPGVWRGSAPAARRGQAPTTSIPARPGLPVSKVQGAFR
ncbi:hypothetical protein [Streptomyces uncialis]|uniref:hypothetical protein n=1 Tax=Streptomyces uncialis TaxID=1048205 RepID=UPI00386EA86F|nr:hypothetical protein OG924_29715 [Streptomyces uncialis]